MGRHRVDARAGAPDGPLLVALPRLLHGTLRLVRRTDPPNQVPARAGLLRGAGRLRARPRRPDRGRRADRLGPRLGPDRPRMGVDGERRRLRALLSGAPRPPDASGTLAGLRN